MKIGTKLIIAFLALATLAAISWHVLIRQNAEVRASFREVHNDNIPAERAVNAIAQSMTRAVAEAEQHMLTDTEDSAREFRESFTRIDREFERYAQIIKRAPLPKYREMVEEMTESLEALRTQTERLRRVGEAIFAKPPSEISDRERHRLLKSLWRTYNRALPTLGQAIDREGQEITDHASNVSKAIGETFTTTLVAITAIFVVAFALALMISQHLARRIRRLSAAARKIAAGNLDTRIQMRSRDEIGELATAFNHMANELLYGETVRIERDYLDTVMNAISDSLIVLNTRGAIVRANPATYALLGYREDELAGAPFAPTLVDADFATFRPALLASQTEDLRDVATDYRTKDGAVIPVSLSWSAMQRDNGSISGFVAVARDRRENQRFIAELKMARDVALDAGRLKSEFLANVSHEIRTPMSAIVGMTDMALDTELTVEQRDYIETVKSASRTLLTLLNDILDLAKIEAGKLDLERIAFSLRESLDETLRPYALRAHQKGLELVCDVAPDVPDAVLGDPGRLRQIVTNLIGNALKFTDQGEVVVRVRADAVTQDAAVLRVTVTDTGIGIAPEDQAAIFAPFVQADGTTTRRYGGTGLGLAICTRLVEMLEGRIWVESAVGRGSTFHVTVPVARQPAGDRALGSGGFGPLRDVTVLVVDDNATSRGTLVEMVKSWGMAPGGVADAAAALVALERAQAAGASFSLAIVDVEMPGMDGIALAQRIEEHVQLAAVPLLLMVSAEKRLAEAQSAPGVAGALLKPIRASHLLEAIQAIRGGRAACQDNSRASALRPASSAGQRVLLAEDDAVNQLVTTRMLEKHGYRVIAVADGRQALTALERERFDVVLMDVQMAVMDGFEATAAIRAREQTSGVRIPIVALTAHALNGDRERCLAAGMDAYIAKPIEASELLATLARLVPGGNVEASGPPPVQATASPVLDRTSLLRRAGGDPARALEMVALVREETTQLLAEIRCGLSQRDPEILARAAHTLKGALATLAARAASDAALRLEALGRTGDLSCIDEAWAALEHELDRLDPELSALAHGDAAAQTG